MSTPKRIDRRQLLLSGSAALVSQLAASGALAQDAVRTQPSAYRVVFENARVRVLEFVSRPRSEVCGVGKHSHPAHLTIALSEAKVRVTLADGKSVVAANKLGDVFWSEAETHAVENIGGGVMRALIVEIKDAAKTRA
jgi:beta-alanine degradation protein BauB